MSLAPSLPDGWRVPLLVGAASIPFTLASYEQSTVSLSAVVFAGVIAGFWTGGADRVGARTGLVAGLVVFRPVVDLVAMLPTLEGPPWFQTAGYGMAFVGAGLFVALGLTLSILLGGLGARFGGWLARRHGRSPPAAGA